MMSPKLNPEIALPAIIPSKLVVYIRMSHPVQYNTVLPSINHFLPRKDVSIRKIGKAIAAVTKIMLPGILKERINFELQSYFPIQNLFSCRKNSKVLHKLIAFRKISMRQS